MTFEERLTEGFRSLIDEPVPTGLPRRVMERLPRQRRPMPPAALLLRTVGSAALVATALLVGYAWLQPTPDPSGEVSDDPSATVAPTRSDAGSPSLTDTPAADPRAVLLRLEVTRGGAWAGSYPALVPVFTLYGAGTVVYWEPRSGPEMPEPTLRTAQLDGRQRDALIAFALDDAGLRTSPTLFPFATFGPAGSTVFTVSAEGVERRVVYQLPPGNLALSDDPQVAGLKRLSARLVRFSKEIALGRAVDSGPYQPPGYRVWLRRLSSDDPRRLPKWPWPEVRLDAFRPASGASEPVVFDLEGEITADQAGSVPPGSLLGTTLLARGPDGNGYELYLRAQLPEESRETATSPPDRFRPAEPFRLHTHCGLGWGLIEFDGAFWEVTGPGPLDDGAGNPPPGFGNPFDEGTISRLDVERATYRSSRGVVLNLERRDERPDAGACF
jgi:hypothetical protein